MLSHGGYLPVHVITWRIFAWSTEKGSIFNTEPYGEPPLKNRILKISFLLAREDQKIDLVIHKKLDVKY